LGASMPATTPYRLNAMSTSGSTWRPLESASPSILDKVVMAGLDVVGRIRRGAPLAVFVDFNENPEDGAFGRFIQVSGRSHRRHHVEDRRRLSDVTGPEAVARAAARIRRVAARQGVSNVDLFLRVPWPAAVLLGRELNTLTLNLYEWSRHEGRGEYY